MKKLDGCIRTNGYHSGFPSLAISSLLAAAIGLVSSASSMAAESEDTRRVPDEYESTAGLSIGLGGSGVAAMSGISAVRLNPAMLALSRQYRLSAGYHWPSVGREYYQAGVIDSTSSSFAAGINYTSAQDDYLKRNPTTSDFEDARERAIHLENDTPIKNRFNLGVGRVFGKVSLGAGVQYLEAWKIDKASGPKIKGTSFSIGAAGLLAPKLRFGGSVENVVNEKIKDYAPRTYRAGLAYQVLEGKFAVHLDYRDRQRVRQEQSVTSSPVLEESSDGESEGKVADLTANERMLTGSFAVQVQNLLRVLGAYGQEVGGAERSSLSGGLALVNNKFSLSYLASIPYMSGKSRVHHSVSLGFDVPM